MYQLTNITLSICLIFGAICPSLQSAETAKLEEIKSQLISESLNSETRVSTVSSIDESGGLKQYSRFYSARQFYPNRYFTGAFDETASVASANGASCYLTSYFRRLPRSFKTIVDLDLSGQTSKNAQQFDVVNKEDFVAALVEKANDLKNETGLYAFAEDNSRLVPLSDSYTQPAGMATVADSWSGSKINILLTPRISTDRSKLVTYAENSLNSLTNYIGYDISFGMFERFPAGLLHLSDSGRLSVDVTITFTTDFDTNLESQESQSFSGNAAELAELVGDMISRKFGDFAESDRCALEFYKPKLVLSNQLAVSSGLNAGVTQTTQFLLLPGLPSEVNVLNSDTLDSIRTAEVVSLKEHETVIRVTGDENINLTGYSVVPL